MDNQQFEILEQFVSTIHKISAIYSILRISTDCSLDELSAILTDWKRSNEEFQDLVYQNNDLIQKNAHLQETLSKLKMREGLYQSELQKAVNALNKNIKITQELRSSIKISPHASDEDYASKYYNSENDYTAIE